MMQGRDFIVFSDDWGRHPFSCQHIMEHFLAHNRVLWVNTIGLRTPKLCLYDLKRSFGKLASWFLPQGKKGGLPPNLRIVAPLMIPYNTVASVRAYNRSCVVRTVREAMKAWGMENPIFLATLPNAADYVGCFDESLVVYYCVDDFTVWPGMNQPELVRGLEADLLNKADMVIAVSDSLCDTRSNGRSATRLLTHGVDVDHFASGDSLPVKPEAMRGLSGPILGFYGLIDSHFDVSLVKGVLNARPDWQIVCIGTKRIDLGSLESEPNFSWIPPVPYAQLPHFAACFDVAFIPYVVNAHTQTANPLKLREYLATGKPVVTTPMAEVFRFKDIIHIADSIDSFVSALDAALQERVSVEERKKVLAGERWSDKAELVSCWIEEEFVSRSAKREKLQ